MVNTSVAQLVKSKLTAPGAEGAAHRLGALLVGSGTLHFLAPKPFDYMVPPQLPGTARTWTYLSGAAELAVAAALLNPSTRRPAGLAAALLFVGVFPGNVQMARKWGNRPPAMRAAAYARLPLQIPLVTEALKVHRGS